MMEHLNMQSMDKVAANVAKIRELFPNCVTERINSEGKLEHAIDFDMLKQELSDHVVDGLAERYQFTWPDKRKAILAANAPINKILRPCREESVDFDNTENLYIEGDNLEVLKLLQETYLGKVKMIYIDPPYNTGKDFVYNDDFKQSTEEYIENSGQLDDAGNRFVANTESNGRFHTNWLNMMYPRLKLAKDLLSEDGVIFISINDKEFNNLSKICEEVFNRKNELGCFCWRTDGNFDNQARIKSCHEYILLYSKNEQKIGLPNAIDPNVPKSSKIFKEEIRNTIIKNGIKNPICEVEIPKGFPADIESCIINKRDLIWPKYSESIIVKNFKTTNKVTASTGWASKEQLVEFISNGYKPVVDTKGQSTTFVMTKTGAIECIKKRRDASHVISVLNNLGGTQKATNDMGEIGNYFDYPKPLSLMKYLSKMYSDKDSLILDFFSGSATTAHAVMQLNAEDGGKRKFIMVQLPEECAENSEAYKAGYKNICEIGKERIRRAGKKIKEENLLTTQDLDIGFRVLKCDSSNMEDVYFTPKEYMDKQQSLFVDNIKKDRSDEDLLFDAMLKLDTPLSSKIEKISIAGKTVYNVAQGHLMACFDKNVTDEVITAIAKEMPSYFVMRDSSQADDSVAINFEQIFNTYSPQTVRRVL